MTNAEKSKMVAGLAGDADETDGADSAAGEAKRNRSRRKSWAQIIGAILSN
jgi:hypothetical protein